MSFETFPLPENNRKIDALTERIAAQHEMLVPVVAKVYEALNGRVNEQAAVVGKVNGKLQRAVNGRIKQQGAAVNGMVGALNDALNNRIAEQGQSLALQSALLSRLAPAQQPSLTAPGGLSGAGAVTSLQPGGAVWPPLTSPATSQTAGVTAPPFPLSPQEVIPQFAPAQPIRQPSLGAGGVSHWMVLVDCNRKTVEMLRSDDPQFPSLIAAGAYVPIRYEHDPLLFPPPEAGSLELAEGWIADNADRQQDWVGIACHARENGGEGWPDSGDFPHNPPQTTAMNGLPVGDWPFDSNGNYIGA